MYQYRTISPGDLSDDEAQAWSALCLATPEFRSPCSAPISPAWWGAGG